MKDLNADDIKKIVQQVMQSDNVFRGYNISALTYSQSQFIAVLDKCFAIMFTNIGDTIARVNGLIIFPSATPATALGDSRTIMAHKFDLYKGQIKLQINNPAGAAPLVEIVQLFYTDSIDIK